MDIEWFRDLTICIFCLGATAALIILTVLACLFYRRVRPVLDSMKKTAGMVAKITSTMETEMAGPVAQVITFVQGCRQAIGLVNRFFRREEEED